MSEITNNRGETIVEQINAATDALRRTGAPPAPPTNAKPLPARPAVSQTSKTRWYEFDGLAKYSDLLMLIGFALFIFGIGQYSTRLAIACAGFGIMILSYNLGKV